ncbi:MAG: hypothetical protein MJ134_07770 [Lachnospiraceae bacterium]|nr:hypothetical protein [Lachnospiraceae bacterium]
MAEHIRMKQVPGGTVSAVDDRILYDVNLSCGIIEGCEISYPGNNMIHINAGYGIIKGGLFEMDDHTLYVDYAEAGEVTGQVYLHFDPAAEDKLTILYETTHTLHQMEQNEDCNYHNKVYEIQLCTFTATTTALLNVEQTWVRATGAVEVLDNLNEIMANTDANKCAGALAVKQLNSNLGGLEFGLMENGKPGWKERGADALVPFKADADFTLISNGFIVPEDGYIIGFLTIVGKGSGDPYDNHYTAASGYIDVSEDRVCTISKSVNSTNGTFTGVVKCAVPVKKGDTITISMTKYAGGGNWAYTESVVYYMK